MTGLVRTTEDKAIAYKAISGAGAIQIKDCKGMEFNIKEVYQTEGVRRDTGEAAILTAIIDDGGKVYQSMSPTLAESVEKLYEIFGDDISGLGVKVATGVSKAGREFFQLELL